MFPICNDRTSILGIPYLHRFVSTCRGDIFAVRRPRNSDHYIVMALVDKKRRSISGFPHLYRLIPACGGDAFIVWRPSDSNYPIYMFKIEDGFTLTWNTV